jgi:hypothetical protein
MSMNNQLAKANLQNSITQYKGQNLLIGDWIRNEADLMVVQTFSEKRIGDFNKEDMKGLVEVMGKWRFLLGVQSESSDSELVFICQFIYDEFKKFTLSDIRLAMNWAISGKTDMSYVSTKALSAAYVSKAILAYEDEKRAIVKRVAYDKEAYERNLQRDEPLNISPEEQANTFLSILMDAYKKYKENGYFYDLGDFIYNWMKKHKIATITKEIVSDAMIYGETRFREFKAEQKHEAGMRRIKIMDSGNDDFHKKKFAREYIIRKFFDKVEFEQLVKLVKVDQFKK